jgi:hypothetical protein
LMASGIIKLLQVTEAPDCRSRSWTAAVTGQAQRD